LSTRSQSLRVLAVARWDAQIDELVEEPMRWSNMFSVSAKTHTKHSP
jgi:hypothetical protein